MKRLKVALLSGGPSPEHEVSVASCKKILANLDKKKFDTTVVMISRENMWDFGDSFENLNKEFDLLGGLKKLQEINPDIVFNGLHGEFGEDGTIQALLEKMGLKFTGSGSKASAKAMDKAISQDIMDDYGIKIIPTIDFWRDSWDIDRLGILNSIKKLGKKLIIKPADGGSSLGIHLNEDTEKILNDIENSFKYSQHIMVQPFLTGREFSCGVLEFDGIPKPLEVTEIITKNSQFFDYESKYENETTIEVTPAKLSIKLTEEIKKFALKSHIAHGCDDYSRVDFLLIDDDIYFLELNTLPGMTEKSLLPQQAESMGIKYSRLLEIIIAAGLK
jgi:D-alanine-D-alanine ligase